MSTRYIRSNTKSKSRILSLLIADDGGIEKAAVSALDSDQVISVINETSSGFDSDQVVAIIDENPSHPTISAASSVNNGGSYFIQDITLDDNGHVTAIASALGGAGTLGSYVKINSTSTAASATGGDAIAIGENAKAIQASEITIGSFAGATVTGSFYGVNVGYYAGHHNKGNYSIAIGYQAMGNQYNYTGQTGANNIAIGKLAMTTNTGSSGNGNVAIGGTDHLTGNLGVITSGSLNVAIGQNVGRLITTGSENTLIGTYNGNHITTGSRNLVVGRNNFNNLNTGNDNILIGGSCGLTSGRSSAIVIGNSLYDKGQNTAYIGGSTGAYNQANSSSWSTTSDQRIKTNVTDYTTGLTILDQVDVKTYNYLSDSDIATAHPELADSDGLVHENLDTTKTVVGLMAQDLETLLPNSVTTRENGIKSVNKDELFWVMLNSIKELKALNDALTASNEALTVRVEALENN